MLESPFHGAQFWNSERCQFLQLPTSSMLSLLGEAKTLSNRNISRSQYHATSGSERCKRRLRHQVFLRCFFRRVLKLDSKLPVRALAARLNF